MVEPGRGELPQGRLLRQGAIKHPPQTSSAWGKTEQDLVNLGAAVHHEHTGPWGDAHTRAVLGLARMSMDIPKRGGWTSQRGHPQEGGLSAGTPLGSLLDRVILASRGSTFSITGGGKDQSVFLTASSIQPRGCLTHRTCHHCSEQLFSLWFPPMKGTIPGWTRWMRPLLGSALLTCLS